MKPAAVPIPQQQQAFVPVMPYGGVPYGAGFYDYNMPPQYVPMQYMMPGQPMDGYGLNQRSANKMNYQNNKPLGDKSAISLQVPNVKSPTESTIPTQGEAPPSESPSVMIQFGESSQVKVEVPEAPQKREEAATHAKSDAAREVEKLAASVSSMTAKPNQADAIRASTSAEVTKVAHAPSTNQPRFASVQTSSTTSTSTLTAALAPATIPAKQNLSTNPPAADIATKKENQKADNWRRPEISVVTDKEPPLRSAPSSTSCSQPSVTPQSHNEWKRGEAVLVTMAMLLARKDDIIRHDKAALIQLYSNGKTTPPELLEFYPEHAKVERSPFLLANVSAKTPGRKGNNGKDEEPHPDETFFGKMAALLKQTVAYSNPQILLLKVVVILVVVSLTLCIIVLIYVAQLTNFKEGLSFAVVLLVASIPMAVEIVTTTTLALGSKELSHEGAIVTRLAAIEVIEKVAKDVVSEYYVSMYRIAATVQLLVLLSIAVLALKPHEYMPAGWETNSKFPDTMVISGGGYADFRQDSNRKDHSFGSRAI